MSEEARQSNRTFLTTIGEIQKLRRRLVVSKALMASSFLGLARATFEGYYLGNVWNAETEELRRWWPQTGWGKHYEENSVPKDEEEFGAVLVHRRRNGLMSLWNAKHCFRGAVRNQRHLALVACGIVATAYLGCGCGSSVTEADTAEPVGDAGEAADSPPDLGPVSDVGENTDMVLDSPTAIDDGVLSDVLDVGLDSVADPSCQPQCFERACGPDGCGGICGYCSGRKTCVDGRCLAGGSCPDGFVLVRGGSFLMGSPLEESGRLDDETPHPATIAADFCLGTTEVTQGEWQALMGNNPSWYRNYSGPNFPVDSVSWWEAAAFCNSLSAREGFEPCYELSQCSGTPGERSEDAFLCETGSRSGMCSGYRLPNEEEWEYAARGGTSTPHYSGTAEDVFATCAEIDPTLTRIAWYCSNSQAAYLSAFGAPIAPQQVGTLLPNPWGLYDMLGNVSEWTETMYRAYGDDVVVPGANRTSSQVLRGGSFDYPARVMRSAMRLKNGPGVGARDTGFRLVRGVDQ